MRLALVVEKENFLRLWIYFLIVMLLVTLKILLPVLLERHIFCLFLNPVLN